MKNFLAYASPVRTAVLAVLCGGVSASADVSLISQTRTTDASASATAGSVVDGPVADLESAPGFGLFDEAVSPLALAIDSSGLPVSVVVSQGVAKQVSTLSLTSFAAQGEASVSLTLTPAAGSSAEASGESLFDVFFSVDLPSHFVISGFVDTQAILTGGAGLPALDNEVSLTRTDDNTLIFSSTTNDESFSQFGLLNPGTYRLWAQATVGAMQFSSPTDTRTVNGISAFEFRMLVTGVPETSTYLSALGLVGLIAMAGRWGRR